MTFWREWLIGALCAALWASSSAWLSARDDVATCKAEHIAAVKAAKDLTDKAVITANKVKEEVNANQSKLVEQAKSSAVENYRRRFGMAVGGSGITGNSHPLGLRVGATDTAGTVQAGNPEVAQGQSAGLPASQTCIPDRRFLDDAASAAAKLAGWEQWRVGNGLEFER